MPVLTPGSSAEYRDINSRDALERATRDELYYFAKDHGIEFDHRTTPADVMRVVLRQKNLTNISVPIRVMGRPIPGSENVDVRQDAVQVKEVDATTDLMKQWQEKGRDIRDMSRAELAKECKRRGIKMKRTDKIEDLRERLGG